MSGGSWARTPQLLGPCASSLHRTEATAVRSLHTTTGEETLFAATREKSAYSKKDPAQPKIK